MNPINRLRQRVSDLERERDKLGADNKELRTVVSRLLEVIKQLMPGIGSISCPDYAEINDAQIAAQAALTNPAPAK